MTDMTPREIVSELDRYIVGQNAAKRAVAVALRNRWRRLQLPEDLRHDIVPKNILMIGPTGVGKTEIARRLAKLANAPFIKVEATKFTEVGYVGRDVETIVRDLVETAMKMQRQDAMAASRAKAEEAAEERLLDALLRPARDDYAAAGSTAPAPQAGDSTTRNLFRRKLRAGELDAREIEIDVAQTQVGVNIMAPPGLEDMTSQLQSMFASLGKDRKKTQRLTVKDAQKLLRDEEAANLVNDDEIKDAALRAVEQGGIVFIDEIDKVCRRAEVSGADVSREGVQRDLLPLIEGCAVTTKYGTVKTDHVLFICSGAFHLCKPSDLIPELQGRLPIRVELDALNADDFERILKEPNNSLTMQYRELLGTEGLMVAFTDDAVRRIAEIAFKVNERTENIGARRLHTVMEKLLEDVSFDAADVALKQSGAPLTIDEAMVDRVLGGIVQDEDLSRYIL